MTEDDSSWYPLEITREDVPTDPNDWIWFRPAPEGWPSTLRPDYFITCYRCEVRFRYVPTDDGSARCRCWNCGRFLKEPIRWQ